MPERYGIYFAPAVTSELWRHASIWLGRDAAKGSGLEADIGGIDPARRHAITRSARRYGFHATLKAPMTLDGKLEGKDLDRALKAWSAVHAPIVIGQMVIASLAGFLAIVPAAQSQTLTDFAAGVTIDFDGFRIPLSDTDRARRHAGAELTPRQAELLEQYGYQYVLEEFLFHMTLTDRLPESESGAVKAAAEAWLAPVLEAELLLDRLVLFHEAEPGAPFKRLRDYPLTGED